MKKKCILWFFLSFFFFSLASVYAADSWEKKSKDFVLLLKAGKYKEAESWLGTPLKKVLSAKKLEDFWKKTNLQLGTFQKWGSIESTISKPYHTILLTVHFDLLPLQFRLTFSSKTKLIEGFFVRAVTRIKNAKYNWPSYVKKGSFTEKSVQFGLKDWMLQGTLTIPKEAKNPPVVVLVHGSGPNDRDESVGPNKPFKDLAWGLASQGIAVFRYDKRTYTHKKKYTQQSASQITLATETMDDAHLALKSISSLFPQSKLWVLGHSQGAYALPQIIKDSKLAVGGIALAAPAYPFEDLIQRQVSYLLQNNPNKSEAALKRVKQTQLDFAKIKAYKKNPKTEIKELFLMGLGRGFWKSVQSYDPVEVVQTLKKPILLLHGKRDYQVSMKSWNIWKEKCEKQKNVTLQLFEGLNHLFFFGKGVSTPKEYFQPGSMDSKVISSISSWIHKKRP